MKSTGTVIALLGALWSGVPNALDWFDILSNAYASMTSSVNSTPAFSEDVSGEERTRLDTEDNY